MTKLNIARSALELSLGGGCIAGGVECSKVPSKVEAKLEEKVKERTKELQKQRDDAEGAKEEMGKKQSDYANGIYNVTVTSTLLIN